MKLKLTDIKRSVIISVFLVLSISSAFGKLKFSIPTLEGCEVIGYPNATINDCGYCVGGGTELDHNYGKDCEGNCFGGAVTDCEGVCGGSAYLDECTGICRTPDEISNNEINVSVNRDCRGLCIPPELSRPQQQAYDRDECGVCRLQSSDKSAFIDCNGNCQLPGIKKVGLICGQCVDKNAQLTDECGNCRNEKKHCSCDKDASICGCNDPNNCYNVKSVIPRAVPNNIESKLLLLGYFHPVVRNLHCLLENELTADIISFPVSFIHKNKTALECKIYLKKEGNYAISLGIIRNSVNLVRDNSVKLMVYNPKEIYNMFNNSEIYPKNITTNDSEQTVSIQFSDPTNSLPEIPFRCKVLYSDNSEELTIEGNELHSCSLNSSKLRSKSQILYISPTFDGINSLSKPFELIITAPSPQLSHQNCYVSEDGLAIIIIFEKPVDINQNMKSSSNLCEYLLTNKTIDYLNLYEIVNCLWASKIQLIITTNRPIADNSVNIKFKEKVIKESNQMIATLNEIELEVTARKLSAEPSWWSFEPMIAITGPSEIPNCGLFALIGHFSSPRGTTDVQFQWDVIGDVSSKLKEYVESNGKSTNLILSSEFFEIHIPYKFTFRAFIPVKDQTLEAGHTLIKLDYETPIVSIYHTRLLQSTPLYTDQDILLLADVSVPECVFPIQKVILFWRVSDPRILFPLKNSKERQSLSFEVKPFSVPADHAVDVYLDSFFGHRYNETSGARFTFVASKGPIKANIANGSTKITIGFKSGSFQLSSKSSISDRKLVYQWSCHDSKTAQPCYHNFNSSNNNRKDSLLIDRDLQRGPVLQFDSSSMEPNKQYWFGLQVFDANDHKIASETEYTLVKVSEDNAPQVFIGPVYVKGKHLVSYNVRLSTNIVPSNTLITVKGIVKPAKVGIRWEAPNSIHLLNWRNQQIGDEIHTELYLHQNQIVPFGIYVVKLIACNSDNHCSEADTSLMAPQTVTMCELSVEHFTEYQSSIANVQNCNTPPNSGPLTYQLYLADESLPNPLPLSVPQFSGVIAFMGTPISASKQITRFAAQVCDRFDNCQLYYSQSVNIERTSNESAAISILLKNATRYHKAGDSIAALSVLGNVLMKQNGLLYPLCEKVINDSIEYSRHALELPQQILTDGHLSVVYSVLSTGLLKTTDTQIKRKLLALIQGYTQKAVALNTLPKMNTIKTVYSNLMKSFVRTDQQKRTNFTHDAELLNDIRVTFKELRVVAAAQVQLGTSVRFSSESDSEGRIIDNAITEIVHHYKVYDLNLRAQLNANTTVEAKIHFGAEVKQNFSSYWNCQQEMLCQSVIFSITIYPSESPYPALEDSHKLSPIIDIVIHAPNTGKEQLVRGLFKAATFQVTLTGNATVGGSDLITRCHYFDESEGMWKRDDVHPLGIAYENVGCWAGHLSSFVVLRTVLGITADYVIGVLVACLMGVLVFGIMLVFFVQKKKEGDNRISPKPNEGIPKKVIENPRYRQPIPKTSIIEIQSAQQTILIGD